MNSLFCYISKLLYQCLTCGIFDDKWCCEECAKTCFLGHDLLYREKIKSYSNLGAGGMHLCQKEKFNFYDKTSKKLNIWDFWMQWMFCLI